MPPKRKYTDAERKERARAASRRYKATAAGKKRINATKRAAAASPEAKAARRDAELRRRYGINSAQYEVIWEAQSRACAICRREPKYLDGRRWPVDHNHATGAVRGILCTYCNRSRLGRGREDITIMENVVDYLQHGAERVALTLKTTSDWGQS